MRVREINTARKRDRRAFAELPFELYRGHACWVPPLRSDIEQAMDPERHPFYLHSAAAFFVAERGGRVRGRLAVLDHAGYNRYHGSKAAFFYYFDAFDDPDAAGALFERAAAWARARGLTTLTGPRGLLPLDGKGLLVEGFDTRAAAGMAYNFPYYERLLVGFEKEVDYLSGALGEGYRLPQRFHRVADYVRQRRGFRLVHFKKNREVIAWLPQIRAIYNSALPVIPGFYPITEEEIQYMGERVLAVTHPQLIKLVLKDEAPVGFVVCYPDLARGLQKAKGRLWPMGLLHLLMARRRTQGVDVNAIGLLPQQQGRGANALLYAALERDLRGMGYRYGNVVQVSERTAQSMKDMEALGVPWRIRHRVYRRVL